MLIKLVLLFNTNNTFNKHEMNFLVLYKFNDDDNYLVVRDIA
jgi:hypothetical protein